MVTGSEDGAIAILQARKPAIAKFIVEAPAAEQRCHNPEKHRVNIDIDASVAVESDEAKVVGPLSRRYSCEELGIFGRRSVPGLCIGVEMFHDNKEPGNGMR